MRREKRLLLVADAVGGVWQYSLELARALRAEQVETVLAVMGPSPSAKQRREAAGFRLVDTGLPLEWIEEDPAPIERAGLELASLARREQADIVQTNSAAILAGGRFDCPVVAVQHSCMASWWAAVRGTELPDHFRWRFELVRAGLQAADAVVTPTAAFGAETARIYGLKTPPIAVHNGRSPLAIPKGAPHDCVFTAGRLWDEGKNLATLDMAAGRLAVPVHAAGPLSGPNGESRAFANIHPRGSLDEAAMGRWLAARPVFASAAMYEPFGLAVLEAAMAGCALVLSDISTFRELWDGAALFVPPTDADGFASTIGDLVGDDYRRDSLGRAARERAGRYTPAATAAHMAALYARLLDQAPVQQETLQAARVAGAAA